MARAKTGAGTDWGAVFRVVQGVEGSYRNRYDAVVAAFGAGVLSGPIPTYNAFWRQDTGGRGNHARSLPASVPNATVERPRPEARVASPLVQARDRLLQVAGQLRARGALSQDEAYTLRLALKRGSASRVSRQDDDERIAAIVSQWTMLADAWESRLTIPDGEGALATADHQATSPPDIDAGIGTASEGVDPQGQGQLPSTVPFGTVVGYEQVPAGLSAARLRSRVLAPVISGFISPAKCVELVRRAATGIRDYEVADVYGELPVTDFRRFATLTDRTVRRWVQKVEDGQIQDRTDGRPQRTIDEYLRHTYPAGVERPRKLLSGHKDWIKEQYTGQPDASMADVARDLSSEFGLNVSVRHVQRILATELADSERLEARGGPLGNVSYRSKLLRETSEPNQCWIGDHTFVNFDHLDPEHPDISLGLPQFDLEFEVAVEVRRRQGVLRRVRSGICVTRWMDACTRLTVGLTIWLSPPNAVQTLASLFLACLRHGIPEMIYTDNGSDFRSNLVQAATSNAGIRHAFSRPATPEGRGKLERSFRTLKKVLARWPGSLCGRQPVRWALEQLLTPAQLQVGMMRHVAWEDRNTPHRSTGLAPAVHFEQAVGARGLSGSSPDAIARLLTLLPYEERQRQVFGVEVGNLPYWDPALKTIPIGSRIFVHSIPNEYEYKYLSAPAPDGSLRYLARASVYDADHPPPDLAEIAAREAEFESSLKRIADDAIRSGDRVARVTEANADGHEIAAAMPPAPVAAASIVAPPVKGLLPAPKGEKQVRTRASSIYEGEIPDPFA